MLSGRAIVKLLTVIVSVTFGAYRLVALRRQSVPASDALGIAVDRRTFVDLFVGVLIGCAGIGLIFAIEVTLGLSKITGVSSARVLLNDWVTWIAVPTVEELLFRSALLGGLLLILPNHPWRAIAASAIVFGGLHALNQHATALAVIGATVGAFAYGIAFSATRRLWLSLGIHFAWNYVQGPLLGFPLSGGIPKQGTFIQLQRLSPSLLTGGSYGPEGGAIGLIGRAIVLALVVAYVWQRKRAAERERARVAA